MLDCRLLHGEAESGHGATPDFTVERVVLRFGTPLEVRDPVGLPGVDRRATLIDLPFQIEGAFRSGGGDDEDLSVLLRGHRREERLLAYVVLVGERFVDDREVERATVAGGDGVAEDFDAGAVREDDRLVAVRPVDAFDETRER